MATFVAERQSNFEGGIRVPGIFYWPGTIKGRACRARTGWSCRSAADDLRYARHRQNLRAFISTAPDISPLLTSGENEFDRQQPFYWHLPSTNPSLAIRDGNYSMVAYRDYEFPRDRAAHRQGGEGN